MKSTMIVAGVAAAAASPLSMSIDGNMRSGAWNNLQAKWKGEHEGFRLAADYDRSKHEGFLHEFSVARNVVNEADVSVDAEFSHNFADNSDSLTANVKAAGVAASATYCNGAVSLEASASSNGFDVKAEYDNDDTALEVSKTFSVGGRDLSFNPRYGVNSKLLASKLRFKVDDDNSVGADVDFNAGDKSVGYKFQYNRALNDGEGLEVGVAPADNELTVEYTSSNLEQGATWTVDAGFDYSKGRDVLTDSRVNLKRSWDW